MGNLNLQLESSCQYLPETIDTQCLKEKVTLLIIRDLMRLNWTVNFLGKKVEIIPPSKYDKKVIKQSMAFKRNEIIAENRKWIDKNIDIARSNLANGYDVLESKIKPEIEICKTRKQHDLFRIFRFFWSSPYTEYVGRRIKLIIRDSGLPEKPVIGIAALGSPIIHIPERDNYIGWDTKTRTKNLNYMMDAYVIGALPPYSFLLGGKLISYLITSNEVKEIFSQKYNESKFSQMAGIFTTSLYGKSSQYNRLKFKDRLLYSPIGETKGYGTFHLTNETFRAMNAFLCEQGIIVSNQFGDGPSWSMRVIRCAAEILDFNPDQLLNHSFKRHIYFVPFASNTISFLNGNEMKLKIYKQNINSITNYWKRRWLYKRKTNSKVLDDVKWFNRELFDI